MAIRYVPEEVTKALITHELAIEATTAAYLDAASSEASTFPVVLGHGSDRSNRFSVKAAATKQLAGLKVGSYWCENAKSGLPRHNSTILLFDQATGRIDALIEAGVANAYRTAAGDAIAVDRLARKDADNLAVFGTGHQARFECQAVMRVRRIRTISVVGRDPVKSRQFAESLGDSAEMQILSAEEACKRADIIVTATSARAPLFSSTWVRPGTHVSCMGADARGKQELPPDLLLRAELYCDYRPQSVAIGELQHVAGAIERELVKATNLGDVLAGRAVGRRNSEDITVFDSSGLGLQDLHLARCLLREWNRGRSWDSSRRGY